MIIAGIIAVPVLMNFVKTTAPRGTVPLTEVEPARDQCQRLADRDDADDGDIGKDVDRVRVGQELLGADREEGNNHYIECEQPEYLHEHPNSDAC